MPKSIEGSAVGALRAELSRSHLSADKHETPVGRFYVFLSFDLVNSTAFKTSHPHRWPLVTKKFYEFVEDQLGKRIPGFRLWKYVGDELLLYKRIRSSKDLHGLVPKIHEALEATINLLYSRFPETKTTLSVKGTTWSAEVHDLPTGALDEGELEKARNIQVGGPALGETQPVDFLGPDIDIGFRIAKYSLARRLVVSADLAYLLFRNRADDSKIEAQLQIVSFEQLKGVWGNRHYPIIWHETNWGTTATSFAYDERFHSEIVRNVRAGKTELLSQLVRVLQDTAQEERLESTWDLLRQSEVSSDPEEVVPAAFSRSIEVHCAAVCFRADGRFLAGRRARDKRRFPGHWEFGCGQLEYSETFEESLKRSYRADFGAEIELLGDGASVRTYYIEDNQEGRRIPGVIFVARVCNPEGVTASKHDEIAWVDVDSMGAIESDQCVPDFIETVRRAQLVWRNQVPDQHSAAS